MKSSDLKTLAALYDRGLLVPFIGSGMSIPACVTWPKLIENLELQSAGTARASHDLIARAQATLERMRREGKDITSAVAEATYVTPKPEGASASRILASLFWPLVCTTNYDDVYLQEVIHNKRPQPRVLGRSDIDCRRLLQHISLPASEIVWALQGLLPPRDASIAKGVANGPGDSNLAEELVVGHAEYRSATHRAAHFRRSFAELFRTRSLLFLGSGLEEQYFRALFDEVIELSGPPVRPHFAIVQKGKLDPDFLRTQYHIECITYPPGKHDHVKRMLRDFSDYLSAKRARPLAWSYAMESPSWIKESSVAGHFKVVRAGQPKVVAAGEALGYSCGRGSAHGSSRGRPLLRKRVTERLGKKRRLLFKWRNDFTVQWEGDGTPYGIVARQLVDIGSNSQDRRDIHHVSVAFKSFLTIAHGDSVNTVHMQLLASGQGRVFEPWVSLVQMARAFGQWRRASLSRQNMTVVIYTVDPGITALLAGGYIDLLEQLEDAPLRLRVEVIDAAGKASASHVVAPADTLLGGILAATDRSPKIHAAPTPSLIFKRHTLEEMRELTLMELGLVSGSTLTIDYR